MDFRICGRVRVKLGDEWPWDWESKKVRDMLGVLLTRPGRTIPADLLLDWLWGREECPTRQTLQGYASKLRRVLESLAEPATVRFVNSGYRIDADAMRVDYHQAKDLLGRGQRATRAGDHERACAMFDEAGELVREPPLVELETERAEAFRRHTDQNVFLPCQYALMDSQLALNSPELVLTALDELQPEHEHNVVLAKKRIDALRAASRQDEATEHYTRTHRLLRRHGLDDAADELRAHAELARARIPSQRPPVEDTPAYRPVPRQLPHDPGPLAGRDGQLAALDTRTEHGRAAGVVILTGTAGVGKTALVVHWARRVRDQFSGGYFYIDMQGFSREPRLEHGQLIRILLHQFGAPADLLGDEQAQFARLATLLGDHRMLLLLDNVSDSRQVIPLLDAVPDSLIVMTSRRRRSNLAIRCGATEITVPPLEGDATREWLNSAIGARRIYEPEKLAELSQLCAGIPLAFNLIAQHAAARPEVSLGEITRLLREEHRVLAVGASRNDSGISIRASFMLSYQALSGEAQRMFRMFGMHPLSTLAFGSAIALTGSTRDSVFDSVDELVHLNLADQTTGRVRMHDLLHEFALERAEQEESRPDQDRAVTRMLDWYLHSANHAERRLFPYRPGVPMIPCNPGVSPADFPDDQGALCWYGGEHDALIAAVHSAHNRGYHEHAWRLANTINEPFKRNGHYHDALSCLDLALKSAQVSDSMEGQSGSLNNLGYICLMTRDYTAADHYFSSSYALCRETGNAQGTAVGLHNLGSQRFYIDDLDGAERFFLDSLACAREHDLDYAIPATLRRLGRLRSVQGDRSQANVLFHEALELNRKLGNTQGIGEVFGDISRLCLDRGDLYAAMDFGHRALAYHQWGQDRAGLAATCCTLAAAQQGRAEHRQAVEYARESVRVCWSTGDIEAEAEALEVLATSLAAVGHDDAAIEGLTQAYWNYRSVGNTEWIPIRDRLVRLGADPAE